MFRSVVVGEFECLFDSLDLENERLRERFSKDFGTRKDFGLLFDSLRDRFDVLIVDVDSDENGLRVETVFLLTK